MSHASAGVDPATLATWSAFIIGVVGLGFAVLSKTLGGITATSRLYRTMRREKEDARVEDLTEDIAYLRGRVTSLVDDQEHIWGLIHEHRVWDHQMVAALRDHDPDARIPPPPPLLPRSALAQQARSAIVAADVHKTIDTIEAKANAGTPPHGLKIPTNGT